MTEQAKIIAKKLYPEIMDTVKFLSTTDRGSQCLAGIQITADYIKERMEALGCTVVYHPDDDYGPTVVARKKGNGKLKMMFYAHMDTVWPDGTCAERPYRVDENYAYGPGVSDCTQGIIASIYSLKILNELKAEDYGELIYVFNPDEEVTSISSTKWLKHYAEEVDIAFCLEGPEQSNTYTTSRMGSVYYNMNVTGKKAHAGVEPEKGANALEELTYKLHEILQNPIDDVSLCICWIKGGSGDCIVADNAWSMLRFRIATQDKKQEIDRMLARINQKAHVEGTTTTIEFWPEGGFLPMPRLPWVDGLCKLVEEISTELGIPLKEAFSGGGADAASTVMAAPTLDGLAPVTYGCHTVDERLELSSVVPRIALLAMLVCRVSRDEDPV